MGLGPRRHSVWRVRPAGAQGSGEGLGLGLAFLKKFRELLADPAHSLPLPLLADSNCVASPTECCLELPVVGLDTGENAVKCSLGIYDVSEWDWVLPSSTSYGLSPSAAHF